MLPVKNLKAESREQCRDVRREMGRHSVDCTEVTVATNHGTITLNGKIKPMRGHEDNFDSASAGLLKALRSRRGVKDVIVEWVSIM